MNERTTGRRRPTRRPWRSVAAATVTTTGLLALVPVQASAAVADRNATLSFESTQLGPEQALFSTGTVDCVNCVDAIGFRVRGEMSGAITIGYRNETDLTTRFDEALRQGTALGLTHQLDGTASFEARIRFNASAELVHSNLFGDTIVDDSGFSSADITVPVACQPSPSGSLTCSTATQTLTAPFFSLTDGGLFGPASVDVIPRLGLDIAFEVLDGSVAFLRVLEVPPSAPDSDTFSVTNRNQVLDPAGISCASPVGEEVTVAYRNISTTVDGSMTTLASPHFLIGGLSGSGVLALPTAQQQVGVSGTLSSPNVKHVLGLVGRDNLPPTADAGAAIYVGLEGVGVGFDGSGTTDNCGIDELTFRWDFSDGGTAFGIAPTHVFNESGSYTGLLTVTDPAGNADTAAFTINVGNQGPVAVAGPDDSGRWGRPIAFNGSAADPGSGDQGTLSFAWDFGDGSPSASGGASTSHSYAAPGVYTATLTACDDEGACDNDERTITVSAREVTASFLGASAGTFGTATTLTASLTDEFGQPVAGRTVTFQVGADPLLTATTNGSGVASVQYTPSVSAGVHQVAVTFAGDALYSGASASGSFTAGAKPTQVVYTGALTGGPNKVITLSASLTDATGTPLAGRTITFQLGSQSATSVTNANGQATTSLKLSQKNGTYTVITTFTATGSDVGQLLGSGDADTFKLQAK